MTIGDRIRKLREDAGISQTSLAKKAGISKQTLYKYEMNIVTNIPLTKIGLLAELLEVTPAYLTGWQYTDSQNREMLFHFYNKLNTAGKQEAVKLVEKLTTQSCYTDSDAAVLNAAHTRTDIIIPKDTDTTDNDIMDDENF